MKITPISHGLDLLATDLVRSPGVHMSDLYGDLYQDLEPKRFVRGSEPNPMLLALGTAWERHLEFLLDRNGVRVLRPGELFTPEGIAYSPDGIVDGDRVVEYKLSSMGVQDLLTSPTNSLPEKFGKYLCQLMAYCFHMETPYARLYFCSIRRPFDPRLLVFDIDFSARDLHANWTALLNHAQHKGLL